LFIDILGCKIIIDIFNPEKLKKLYQPAWDSDGEDNGQIAIIGGSKLFHGAPIFALKAASKMVDMVFFATPESSVGKVAERMKAELSSFIWVPWEDTEAYIEKSDAILIGPGFMRYGSEKTPINKRDHNNHDEGIFTRKITETLLKKYKHKKWVIDAGSLQVMDPEWTPKGAILTPNKREFEILFKVEIKEHQPQSEIAEIVRTKAKKHNCIIVFKGPKTIVCSPTKCTLIEGGNPGLTKGGTGDVLAGLTTALLAKNKPFLAATSASFILKRTADILFEEVGVNYSADDLVDKLPEVLHIMK